MTTIYLAGGCFWGMQKFFDQFPEISETETGYANGASENPSYEDVCRNSGHAETVRIVFDETAMPVERLLDYYFMAIDPFSVNRQGEDFGIQYRTGIYSDDSALLAQARAYCARKTAEFGRAMAVEVLPLENFYPAEAYHQKYLEQHPDGYCHIGQSLLHLQSKKHR